MVKSRWLWLSFATAVIGLWCYYFSFVSNSEVKKGTETNLHVLEHKAVSLLDSIHSHLHNTPKRNFVNYLALSFPSTYNEEGIACFIYENDSLQYWTDSHVAVENYMLNVCLEKRVVKLKNGYYEVIRHPKNAYSTFQLYALVLIKNNFPYENRYLKNDFNKKLELPDGAVFNENESTIKSGIQINNYQGQNVFNLGMSGEGRRSLFSLLSFLSFCISNFCFLFFLKKEVLRRQTITGLVIWIACIFAFFVEIGVLLFNADVLFIPASLTYDKESFYSLIFILVLVLTTCWVLYVLKNISFSDTGSSIISFFFFSVITYLLGYGINACLYKIFGKAYISTDLSDIVLSSSLEVYFSYALIFLLLFCFVVFCEIALKLFETKINRNYILVSFGLIFASALIYHFFEQYDILTAIWPGLFFLLLLVSKKLCTNNRFLYGILICLFISFFSAYLTIDQKNKTDYEQRMNLAKQLASPKDEIAENLFSSVKNAISSDEELLRIILKKDKSVGDVEQYMMRKYFTGYWEKYNISICVFDSLCFPLVQHPQQVYNNNSYFDELIASKLKPSNCEKLYFNEQLKDKTFYLFKTPLKTLHKPNLLYVVIESKKAPEYRGFPDLLLNRSSLALNVDYSYVVYKNGQAHIKQGRYEYANFFSYPDDIQNNWIFQKNGYSHLIYKPDSNTKIIVSKSYSYFNDLFSTIGFLFLASSSVFLLFSLSISFSSKNDNSLSIKIQHYAAVGICVLFIPVAISTISLVKNQINKQNIDAIKEKTQTLANYLSVRLVDYDTLKSGQKDYVSYLLAQASGLFKSDLTLFYTNGEYYTTSLPKLFEEGLISKKLNPTVYANILNENQNKDVVNESIGNLYFYSAYSMVKNKYGGNLCVVNLPYFSKQSELQAQLFGYLSALLNIYILAFMIVSVSVALLANWLTRPLRQLQNQFKEIGLNRKDHSIKYDKNDEIGVLISAYNTMLVQLNQSAEKLAQSEREGAWKEMARQVAHEIKNPLTPMKLSIQHVQRLMETNPKEASEHIKRISPILLEQIDALSHIATEFSNFWQLPPPKFENMELVAFFESLLPLYNNNSDISFKFKSTEKQANVNADKDQLLRVMNNLVNNAVQSINEKGSIILELKKETGKIIVSFSDTGTGIDGSVKDKIFQPNFSTKSYGTGLGLAMCKRIIEQHSGTIWFESETGTGTTFYFTLNEV